MGKSRIQSVGIYFLVVAALLISCSEEKSVTDSERAEGYVKQKNGLVEEISVLEKRVTVKARKFEKLNKQHDPFKRQIERLVAINSLFSRIEKRHETLESKLNSIREGFKDSQIFDLQLHISSEQSAGTNGVDVQNLELHYTQLKVGSYHFRAGTGISFPHKKSTDSGQLKELIDAISESGEAGLYEQFRVKYELLNSLLSSKKVRPLLELGREAFWVLEGAPDADGVPGGAGAIPYVQGECKSMGDMVVRFGPPTHRTYLGKEVGSKGTPVLWWGRTGVVVGRSEGIIERVLYCFRKG